jgi:hypothetical protein
MLGSKFNGNDCSKKLAGNPVLLNMIGSLLLGFDNNIMCCGGNEEEEEEVIGDGLQATVLEEEEELEEEDEEESTLFLPLPLPPTHGMDQKSGSCSGFDRARTKVPLTLILWMECAKKTRSFKNSSW